MPTVGEQLKAARVAKQLSVRDVAQMTKIQPWIVESLEADKLQASMNPAYVRNFLGTYARFLALPPAPLLTQLFPEPVMAQNHARPQPAARPKTAPMRAVERPVERQAVQRPVAVAIAARAAVAPAPTPVVIAPVSPVKAPLVVASTADARPAIKFSVPKLPKITLPTMQLPQMPKVTIPEVRLPQIRLPEFTMPRVSMPEFSMPEIPWHLLKSRPVAVVALIALVIAVRGHLPGLSKVPHQPASVGIMPAGGPPKPAKADAKPIAAKASASAPVEKPKTKPAAAPAKPAAPAASKPQPAVVKPPATPAKPAPAAAKPKPQAAAVAPVPVVEKPLAAQPVAAVVPAATVAPKPQPAAAPAAKPIVPADQALELSLSTKQAMMVAVKVDGKVVAQRQMGAGAKASWKARAAIELIVSKPSYAEASLNGAPLAKALLSSGGRLVMTHQRIERLPES